MLENTPDVKDKILHVCDNCHCSVHSNALLARCILNGLLTDPVPEELSKLNSLETQLIQCAKAFQTIVRLGTYTGKVLMYNSLKAMKGNMFFLPLPLNDTLDKRNALVNIYIIWLLDAEKN